MAIINLSVMQNRVRHLNQFSVRGGSKYLLYWMQMNRRVDGNHALAYAAQMANDLGLPLLVYEGLTCSYPWANDRLHTFVLEGVADTAKRLGGMGIGYCFYLRRKRKNPNDVVYSLAEDAGAIITDDYPTFIAASHNESVSQKVEIPYQVVDSSCVVPMNLLNKREYAAYTIRPKIHRYLRDFMVPVPEIRMRRKYDESLSADAKKFHTEVTKENIPDLVATCEIDHSIPPSLSFQGGASEAKRHLDHFLKNNLRRYGQDRNEPSAHATSDLSPYLHFGAIGTIEIALAARSYADEHNLGADEYLEELIVRRELAFNYARHVERPDCLSGLPDWAMDTLRKHSKDKREHIYTRDQFVNAETRDPLWNAAQKEMLLRGKIHGYYRMYWGKKIIEWSRTCQDALETMIYIHDRWALDGRDPNTYTNILWCFGLHDRPWQERPVFGLVRYMSFDGMKRKTNIDAYLREIRHMEETNQDPFCLK